MQYLAFRDEGLGSELVIVLLPDHVDEPDAQQLPLHPTALHHPLEQLLSEMMAPFPGDGVRVTAYSYAQLFRDLCMTIARVDAYRDTITLVGAVDDEKVEEKSDSLCQPLQ